MLNPTGKSVRIVDPQGHGQYGARRSGGRFHRGVDYVCKPGQQVVSPISGVVVRYARPYAKGEFQGLLIQGPHIAVKLFYLVPSVLPGRQVAQGSVIGVAQDISKKYPGMIPHIHIEVESMDVEILTEEL